MTFYDPDGRPMSVQEWAAAYEDIDTRILARTQIGPMTVITAWLGMADFEEEPPLIFGSIIKVDQKWGQEIRTPTKDDAMAAHLELVRRCEERLQGQGSRE